MEHAYSFLWSILEYNYFMLWRFWMQWHHKNYSCTFFQKRLVAKLEMFFVKLYRAKHEFKSERNLNKLACNYLNSTKKTFKTKSILLFLSPLRYPPIHSKRFSGSVTNSKFVLKVLAIFWFSETILTLPTNVILKPPCECFFDK